jgi:hypothetical protein
MLLKRSLLVDNGGSLLKPVAQEMKCNAIQLNMIPDKLIVFCRKLNMITCDSDSFLTIKNININFNNYAGLLSNMSQEQLYKASVASGLHMSWQEFSGLTMSTSNISYNDSISESQTRIFGVGAYAPFGTGTETETYKRTPGVQLIPTVGSMLVLDFATVIQLTEDYYAPGSIGNFSASNFDTSS